MKDYLSDAISRNLSFVHELAHAVMWVYNIDREMYCVDPLINGIPWNNIFQKYTESFAIKTQYMIRDEMGVYDSNYLNSSANIYYINDRGYYCYKEDNIVNEYGAFPSTTSKGYYAKTNKYMSLVYMKLMYTHRLDLFYAR